MKLSEILGWPLKPLCPKHDDNFIVRCAYCDDAVSQGLMLTSCDREIDEEALIRVINNASLYKEVGTDDRLADAIISTMPTWLKPTERK